MSTNQQIGFAIEKKVINYLTKYGLKLITHNFSCKLGEIDLIMQDDQQIIFIEVKYRHSKQFGQACEMVPTSKQTKIIHTAQIFLQKHSQFNYCHCRFDLVAVDDIMDKFKVTWIKNAFDTVCS